MWLSFIQTKMNTRTRKKCQKRQSCTGSPGSHYARLCGQPVGQSRLPPNTMRRNIRAYPVHHVGCTPNCTMCAPSPISMWAMLYNRRRRPHLWSRFGWVLAGGGGTAACPALSLHHTGHHPHHPLHHNLWHKGSSKNGGHYCLLEEWVDILINDLAKCQQLKI